MKDLDLVIIDDDKSSIIVLSEILRETVRSIQVFSSPEEALSSMLKNPPNMLIMDIHMPRLGGIALCDIIRRTESLADLPIVLVSADRDIGDFSLYFKGVDFVQKPFDADVLINKVKLYHRLKTAKDTADKIIKRLS